MAVADQIPTQSGFHAKSTTADVLEGFDLSGRVAVVTGGYSGIGLETVRALAGKGAKVIVPVRTEAKAQEALADIAGDVRTAPMDLGDLRTVRAFTDSVVSEFKRLDMLINNAGVMACPLAHVGPGWESQFGICHMGHFALTLGLMDLIKATEGARVVALSSTAHKLSDIQWDDIHFVKGYNKWQAYGQAKTANALFANGLSRRLETGGALAFAVHPGGIFTPLQRHLPKEEMVALGWIEENGEPSALAKSGFKTPDQGASTTLWAATSAKLDGKPGVYCENADIAAITDAESPLARYMGVDPHACSDESAERLWTLSETLLADA